MSEKEKMNSGKIYDPSDEELLRRRNKSHHLCLEFNRLYEGDVRRDEILKELFDGNNSGVALVGPIYFDYGCFTSFGENCFANFNLTVLDCARVTIGNDVFIGPNVSLVTPIHPYLASERKMFVNDKGVLTDLEYAKPIVIEDGCWLASNVVVTGGVKIGKNSIIGAGSVVTRDIPANSLAVGNPCRVIRTINEKDSIYLKKELF